MSRRVELLIALLLAVTLAIAFVLGGQPQRQSPLDFRTSTLRSGPEGSKAIYEVLRRMRVPVERRRRPLFDLMHDSLHRPVALAVIAPVEKLAPGELAQVARFVRSGGELVLAGNGGGVAGCVGWGAARAGTGFGDSVPVVAPETPGGSLPAVQRVLRPGARPSEEEDEEEGKDRGIEDDRRVPTACRLLAPQRRDTLLRTRDRRPVVLRLHYPGGGRVLLVADPQYFRNRIWRETAVPYFLVPALTPLRRGRFAWDEYHQGFGEGRSVPGALLHWLGTTPGGWALLQLVGVALVALAVAAIRFGPARRVIERRRRSPLEHLEALAAGLEGAAGVDTAVALTVSGLQRRLGRTGVLHAEEQRAWLAGLELALPTPAGREAVRRLQRTIAQPGGPERALAAAQAVEDVWEELRPQPMRAPS